MARAPQIAVQISATDQYSATLAKLRKDLATTAGEARKLGRQADAGFNSQIAAVLKGTSARLGAAHSGVADMFRRAQGGVGTTAGIIPGLGAIGGAATLAGLGALVTRYSDMGVQLTNVSRLAGNTVQGMDSLRGAARLVGISAETADGAMVGLNKTVADAYYGKNPQAAAQFRQLGIGLEAMGGGARRAEDVLPRIADSIRAIARVDPRAAVTAMGQLGLSPDMLPLLIRGADGIGNLRREVESLYGNWDNYQRSSERFTESMGRMGIVTDRLGMSIMTALEPHLTPMLKNLATWVDAHNKDIGDTFDHIGHAISNVDWKAVGRGVEDAGNYARTAAKWFDDLASSWDKINALGQPVADVLNRLAGVGSGGQPTIPAGSPAFERLSRTPNGQEMMGLEGWAPRGTPPSRLPPAPPRPTNPEQESRAQRARDILVERGWTPQQAAGIVANLHQESGFSEGAVGDGGQAYGIAQWHPDRRASIARGMGRDVVGMGFEDQVRAVDWELRNTEQRAGQALRNARTAAEAGEVVSRLYERPAAADAEARNRGFGAARWEQRWGSQPRPEPRPEEPDLSRGGRVLTQEEPDLSRGGRLRANPATDNSNGSTVRIEIDHTNAPAGTNLRATTQGDGAEIGGIRIRRAMPDAGFAPAFGGT